MDSQITVSINGDSLRESSGRYLFLDILKVVALILMPCIHAFNVVVGFGLTGEQFPVETVSTQMGYIYLIVPGVFMFCMGAGIVLSRKQSPKALLLRGLKLLMIGFVLNTLRASIYIWFGLLGGEGMFLEFWYWLWGSDILYFAGLYFLLFALFRRLKLGDAAIAAVSVAMLLLSHLTMPVSVENVTLAELFGNFVYVDGDSCFPLLSWCVFPTAGYLYMKRLSAGAKRTRCVAVSAAAAATVLGITIAVLTFTDSMQSRYFLWGEEGFMMDIPSALIAVSAAVIYASAVFGIASLFKEGKLTAAIEKVSAKVNTIYCIHWVLITYMGFFWLLLSDCTVESAAAVYAIGVTVFAVSLILALTYGKLKAKTSNKRLKSEK